MKKILVVDDEANIRELYKEELEDMGYEVTTVDDGIEALAVMDKPRSSISSPWTCACRTWTASRPCAR